MLPIRDRWQRRTRTDADSRPNAGAKAYSRREWLRAGHHTVEIYAQQPHEAQTQFENCELVQTKRCPFTARNYCRPQCRQNRDHGGTTPNVLRRFRE